MSFKLGDIVLLNGVLAAVVGIEGDPGIPEGHVALWYGGSRNVEPSFTVFEAPLAWTVPAEYCTLAPPIKLQH